MHPLHKIRPYCIATDGSQQALILSVVNDQQRLPKLLNSFEISPTRITCPANLILLGLVTNNIR